MQDIVWNVRRDGTFDDEDHIESRESLHPYFGTCRYSGVVRIERAKGLQIVFDPRRYVGITVSHRMWLSGCAPNSPPSPPRYGNGLTAV